MQKTNIEWADYVWNPVTGCSKVSQGCKNCYAETFNHRFEKIRGKFTDVVCHEDRLSQPLKEKKGGIVFVNSMSDLFHEDVPFEFILSVFNVMMGAANHQFLILTKRPKRALEFFQDYCANWLTVLSAILPTTLDKEYKPLPNVWIGVSVEDQATANERIPLLLQIPAAVRFLSCEPLLGPIDLIDVHVPGDSMDVLPVTALLDWVICGGESGHKARPMHPDWARSLRDQCASANVPFFFKQWGEWIDHTQISDEQAKNKKPKALSEGHAWFKVGKSKSGHLLDGKEHRAFPTQHSQLTTHN